MSGTASGNEPRAAYVHVPFCRHRCGYCNFTLIAGRDDLIERYLAALERELRVLGHPRSISTLFLGGGTPTHLPPRQLQHLLKLVRTWFDLEPGYEFSIEANPIDCDTTKIEILAEAGVTRLSLGAQSFQAQKLHTLERDHTAELIGESVARAKNYIQSISIDLIFAVPGETVASWQADLRQALSLAPQHVSTYGLTLERGTTFWSRKLKGELQEVDDEIWRYCYALAIDELTAQGFEHYEISNFALPGQRCRHNEAYWRGDEYYAVGPGAARYIHGRREVNHRSTTTWMTRVLSGQSAIAESEELSPEDRAREKLVLALRTMAGVDPIQFERETHYKLEHLVGAEVERHLAMGTLIQEGRRLRLSREGLFVSDAIWPDFLRC